MTLPIPEQPRPVVDAAESQQRRGDIIGATAAVLGGLPALLLTFGVINWSADQIAAYGVFLGVFTGAVMVIFGRRDVGTALAIEDVVTPVASPRDDDLVPLVPIANDGLED
jgi:hypothetical protein